MLLLDLHDVSTEEQDVGEGGRAGKLSAEEEGVLERARDESARITREELPRMFETGSARKALLSSGARTTTFGDETDEEDGGTEYARSREAAGPLTRTLEFLDRPFRGMPAAWRMGLGLSGVLHLITLLVVILVRTWRG